MKKIDPQLSATVAPALSIGNPADSPRRLPSSKQARRAGVVRRLRHRSSVFVMVALPIALVVSASAASGQDKPEFYRGFYGEIGGFLPLDIRMTLGIQIPGVGEEEIDLDRDLGLEQEVDRFRFGGGYRFNRRHEIEFSYLSVRRSNTRSIEETFDFLGREFTAGLTLDTTMRTKDIELGYKYFIIVRPKMEFGFSTGIHFVPVDFSVDARAFLTEQRTTYLTGPDLTGRISIDYAVTSMPTTYFITRDGKIFKKWAGLIDEKRLNAFVDELVNM